jgi:hypothetical protein
MPDAGQMDALERAMNFVAFSLFSLDFDVNRFSFLLTLMDFLLILCSYAS